MNEDLFPNCNLEQIENLGWRVESFNSEGPEYTIYFRNQKDQSTRPIPIWVKELMDSAREQGKYVVREAVKDVLFPESVHPLFRKA